MTLGVERLAERSGPRDAVTFAGRSGVSPRGMLIAGVLALAAGVYVVGSTLTGVLLNYSPVPFYDQWDGYIYKYMAFQVHPWAAMWAAHNEHRQVLARLAFIPDVAWFGGLDRLSLAVDLLFCALTVVLFLRILRRASERHLATDLFLTGLVLACGFCWAQSENFTAGFQIPFFAVCLFALLSFHALVRCREYGGSNWWFGASIASGIAAALSMANGLLILPLVCVFALLLRMSWRQVIVAGVIAVLMWAAYLYHPPGVPGALTAGDSPARVLLRHPLLSLAFVLLYLGSPAWHLLGGSQPLQWQLEFALGLLTVAGIIAGFAMVRRQPGRVRAPELWMIAVAAGASAVLTAGGRLPIGLIAALMPRYTTQAFMAWIGLLLFFTLNLHGERRRPLFALSALVMIGAVIGQSAAFSPDRLLAFEKRVDGLALRNDVFDEQYTKAIYPSRDALVATARLAKAEGLSIFAHDAAGYLDPPAYPIAGHACAGEVDAVRPTATAGKLVLEGWGFDRADRDVPDGIAVVNAQGQTVGSGIFGKSRRDIRARLGIKRKRTGWVAFANASPGGYQVLARTDTGAYCTIGGVVGLPPAK